MEITFIKKEDIENPDIIENISDLENTKGILLHQIEGSDYWIEISNDNEFIVPNGWDNPKTKSLYNAFEMLKEFIKDSGCKL